MMPGQFCWLIVGVCSSVCDKHSMWPLKDYFTENERSVIIYSPSGHFKTVRLSVFLETRKKIFWRKFQPMLCRTIKNKLFYKRQNVMQVWNNNRVRRWWKNCNFGVNYPFKFQKDTKHYKISKKKKKINIILKPLFWSYLRVMRFHEKSRDVWLVCVVLLRWIFTMNRYSFGLFNDLVLTHLTDSVTMSYQLTGGEEYF